jgi:hypothetical protein
MAKRSSFVLSKKKEEEEKFGRKLVDILNDEDMLICH